jgi:hypothetical protein
MAEVIYKIQAPDGSILRIQGPEGASEADLQQAAEEHYASIKKPASKETPKEPPQAAPEPEKKIAKPNPFANPETVYDPVSGVPMDYGMGQATGAALMSGSAGLLKPFAGAAQFLGINKPAQALEGVTKMGEQVGGNAAKFADVAGQIASPAPMKLAQMAGKATKAVPFLGSATSKLGSALDKSVLAKSAAQGAGYAALTPIEDVDNYGDFLEKKAEQTGQGALLGGALGKAGQLAFDPRVTAHMRELKDLGMKYFTPGQLASQIPLIGGALRKMESASTSIPIAGNLIERGAQKVNEQFNKSIGDRVLAPMGEKVPKDVKAGEELIEYVNNRVSDAYDNITPKLKLTNMVYKNTTTPTGFTTTTKALNDKLAEVTQGLPSAQGNNLGDMVRSEFNRYILEPLATNRKMTGKEFRDAEKNLGRVAYSYMRNPQYYDVGVALRELQSELRQELINQNPKIAKELQGIHLAFRRHLPMERAASYVGAEGRVFGPSQFESAVKAETKGKGQFASGQALLYPESQAAVNVLGKKVPDSGTAQRLMTGTALLTAPLHWKASALPALATAGLYNVPAMKAMTALATERPAAMRKLGEPVRGGLSQLGGVMAAQPAQEEE